MPLALSRRERVVIKLRALPSLPPAPNHSVGIAPAHVSRLLLTVPALSPRCFATLPSASPFQSFEGALSASPSTDCCSSVTTRASCATTIADRLRHRNGRVVSTRPRAFQPRRRRMSLPINPDGLGLANDLHVTVSIGSSACAADNIPYRCCPARSCNRTCQALSRVEGPHKHTRP